jgi:hypothetical protein
MIDVKMFILINKETMLNVAQKLNVTIENEYLSLLFTNLFAYIMIFMCVWIIIYLYSNLLPRKFRRFKAW